MHRRPIEILWPGPALLLFACGGGVQTASSPPQERESVLIILVDDLGIEKTGVYGFLGVDGEPLAARTPNIDRFARQGITFRNAWAAPVCSSARAELLTGRYPNRTGIGTIVRPEHSGATPEVGLRDDQVTIPDLLPPDYLSGVIGKWHLAAPRPMGSRVGGIDHAPRCGFGFHVGSFGNLEEAEDGYFEWELLSTSLGSLEASRVTEVTTYATTRTTDDALRSIRSFGETPFFLLVSYNAPHDPFHVPPAHLFQNPDLDLATDVGRVKAMIEALDSEIGRLLEGIEPSVLSSTTVILASDNGTQRHVTEPPWEFTRAKSTVYNGGIHVPFLVTSPRIRVEHRGAECERLIDFTDVLPTVAELVGVSPPDDVDGSSFLPYLHDPEWPARREWIYAERFRPNFVPSDDNTIADQHPDLYLQAARDERYKLLRIRKPGASPIDRFELYDLEEDFLETRNLLAAPGGLPDRLESVHQRLRRVLEEMDG